MGIGIGLRELRGEHIDGRRGCFSAGACVGEPGKIPDNGEFEESIVNALISARSTLDVFFSSCALEAPVDAE